MKFKNNLFKYKIIILSEKKMYWLINVISLFLLVIVNIFFFV